MALETIVDTSVWIDYFSGKISSAHAKMLQLLLEQNQVVITDIIKHELLIGTNSQKEYDLLAHNLSGLKELWIEREFLKEFNQFGFDLRKAGLLGKYTDASIAFLASKHRMPVFSFDRYFHKLSQKKLISLMGEMIV